MNAVLPLSRAGVAAPPASGGRDLLVDILRGMALVFIVVDHINLIARDLGDIGGARLYLLIDMQLADAAEIFVFLSGYVFGMVHGAPGRRLGPADLARRTLRRMIQIFGAYALTLVVVAALHALLSGAGAVPPTWMEISHLYLLDVPGLVLLTGMAQMMVTVFFVNILHLYILLLAYALPMLLLWHRAPVAAVAISAALWFVAQFIDPMDMPRWAGMRAFNPLGWQLLFCAGLFLGTRRWLDTIRSRPDPRWLALAIAIVAVSFLLRLGVSRFGEDYLPRALVDLAQLAAATAKPALGPARLIDFAALVYLAWTLLPPAARLMRWRPARMLAALGSHSLEMFCVGTVMIMLGSLALHLAGGGFAAYLAVIGAMLAVYATAGQVTAWLLAKPARPAAAHSAPASPGRH